jgi:hypothetical protein
MAGLVPAIHVLFPLMRCEDVDARHKAGHDDMDVNRLHCDPKRHHFKAGFGLFLIAICAPSRSSSSASDL